MTKNIVEGDCCIWAWSQLNPEAQVLGSQISSFYSSPIGYIYQKQ